MTHFVAASPAAPTSPEVPFPISSPPRARGDKIGTRKHLKSAFSDANFLKRLKALRKAKDSAPTSMTIVRVSALSARASALSPSPTLRLIERKPPEWRDVGDEVHAIMLHEALARRDEVIGFSVNLDSAMRDRARRASSFLDYVRRNIQREIRAAFGDDVRWWLAVEEVFDVEVGESRPHLHGEIVIPGLQAVVTDPVQYRLWRKFRVQWRLANRKIKTGFLWSDPAARSKLGGALRRGAGEWATSRQYQTDIFPDVDSDWPVYATKNAWKARPGMRKFLKSLGAGPRYVLSFEGKVITATGCLKHEAKAIYNEIVGRD